VERSLWREDGSVAYSWLLALASAVILGSESLGTRDHILLSQIWDFLFGTSYSPPHGFFQSLSHIATDGQSVTKSWCPAPFGAYDQIFSTVWQLRSSSILWGALSNERAGLSFVRVIGCISKSFVRLRFPRRWLWWLSSSGRWRRVALIRADVSEDRIASIFRVHECELVTERSC
jgi:hypothetical protein